MRKLFLSGLLWVVACSAAFAQAIVDDDAYMAPPLCAGFRASPDGAGLSTRYYFKENLAVEALVNFSAGNFYDNGTSLTVGAMFEYFILFDNTHWRLFTGAGPHWGRWSRYRDAKVNPVSTIGIDAIIGAEYILQGAPIGISVDLKPALQYVAGVTYLPNNSIGLGVRYYFGRWSGGSAGTPVPVTE